MILTDYPSGLTMSSLMNLRFFRSQIAFLTCILLTTYQSCASTTKVIYHELYFL